jgi:hypothetical protein
MGDPRRSAYVVLYDDSRTMCGDPDALRAAEAQRRGHEDLIWFRVDDDTYVIRDQGTIAETIAMFEARSRVHDRQAALADRQAEMAEREFEIAEQQAKIRDEIVRVDKASQATIEDKRVETSRKVEKIARERSRMQSEQVQLEAKQEALAAELAARSTAALDGFSRMISDAITNGTAEKVH